MIAISLIALILAVARLTLILVKDDIFQPIRHRIYLAFPPEDDEDHYYQNWHRWKNRHTPTGVNRDLFGRRYKYGVHTKPRKSSVIGKITSCPDCAGVWIGAIGVIAYYHYPVEVFWLCLPFAASMVTSLIARRY